jgi:hypothetical protein
VTNPIGLAWWAVSQHVFLIALGLITLGVVVAFVVFGGGWS